MPSKRKPKRVAQRKPTRKNNTVLSNQESHHERNPGAWMPQCSHPRFLESGHNRLPSDFTDNRWDEGE